jgi:hypothetical protein
MLTTFLSVFILGHDVEGEYYICINDEHPCRYNAKYFDCFRERERERERETVSSIRMPFSDCCFIVDDDLGPA